MTDFEAIDALLSAAKKEVPLPPAEERRALREELNVSRAQLAQALEVSPSTVGGWEAGRDPSGEVREKYAYFLQGARSKLAAEAAEETPAEVPGGDAVADAGQSDGQGDDVDVLIAPKPCVLCGQPAHPLARSARHPRRTRHPGRQRHGQRPLRQDQSRSRRRCPRRGRRRP